MKVLVAPWGRRFGHTGRAAAIARAALVAGDEAVLYAPPDAGTLGNGIDEVVPIARTDVPSRADNPWDYWRSPELTAELLDADLDLLAREQPDVVVVDGRFTTVIAAEHFSIPIFSIVKACCIPGQRYHSNDRYWEDMFRPLETVIQKLGGPSLVADTRELFVRNEIVCPSIAEFEQLPPLPGLAEPLYTGAIAWDPPNDTPGTDVDRDRDVAVYGAVLTPDDLALLATSFAHTEYRLVLVSPEPGIMEVTSSLDPSRVVSIPYLSFEKQLHRFAGAITHAGHGSCLTALGTGTATLLLPHPGQMEQRDNAQRMCALGVADAIYSRADWHTAGAAFAALKRSDRLNVRLTELQARAQQQQRGADGVVRHIRRLFTADKPGTDPGRGGE